MDFQLLQGRLIAHIRARVQNGEITERSLARLSGISQPHLHNVLKGARSLSPTVADKILPHLRIDLLEVAEGVPAGGLPPRGPGDKGIYRIVPLLDGYIGPGHPFPAPGAGNDGYPFRWSDLEGLESVVAVRLAPDPHLAELFGSGAVVLLDCSEARRNDPDEGYYALDLEGDSAIRLVRRSGRRLCALGREAGDDPREWPWLPLSDRGLLRMLKGRVSFVLRRP